MMGARPLARLIQEKIKKPLAEELLFGRLQKGGEVQVDYQDAAFTLEVPQHSIGEEKRLPAPV